MSEDVKVCIACDCWGLAHYTPQGKGPFCGECWESLCDPDQSLLLEKRVAAYEVEVEELRARVALLEEFVSACRYAGPGGLERLKQEATKLCAGRKAAK
jgi:hypothetical protein